MRRRSPSYVPWAALLVAILAAPAAMAYSSYGLGALSCGTYLERRAEDQQAGTMDRTVFIHAFLSGYLTAGNTLRGLVGDHAHDVAVEVHAVVQWLDAHCEAHRDITVAAALETFWVEATAAIDQIRRLGPEAARRAAEQAKGDR